MTYDQRLERQTHCYTPLDGKWAISTNPPRTNSAIFRIMCRDKAANFFYTPSSGAFFDLFNFGFIFSALTKALHTLFNGFNVALKIESELFAIGFVVTTARTSDSEFPARLMQCIHWILRHSAAEPECIHYDLPSKKPPSRVATPFWPLS